MMYYESKLIQLRRRLHRFPELSGHEDKTARLVKHVLSEFQPDSLVEKLGGWGIAAVFNGKNPGPTILFRCELDALPIEETNSFNYRSTDSNVAHKCGHDGHMTIMLGLAEAVYNDPPLRGRIILLFQPSEENGQGALKVLNDRKFTAIKPDFVFALHNLPGYPENSVVLRSGNFASASKGMINRLYGKTSHAGEPENGISPALAMADIIRDLTFLPQLNVYEKFTLVTVVHSRLGEVAFGTNPGYAEVMATLRTHSNRDMVLLTDEASGLVNRHARISNLKTEIEWTEAFPATVNNKDALEVVEKVARTGGIQIVYLDEPLRWSEDFSNFTARYPGVLFGLGAGEEHAQLHNPDYDFPDNLMANGIGIFFGIYQYFLK